VSKPDRDSGRLLPDGEIVTADGSHSGNSAGADCERRSVSI